MGRMPNWIELDGVVNMRDVGGIPTTDGGAIRPGRLLRSDNLQSLSPADIAELRGRGLSDVIDMRSGVEVRSEGPGPLVGTPGVRFHHRSVFVEDPDLFAGFPDGGPHTDSRAGAGADGTDTADGAVDPIPGSSAGPGGPEPVRTELDHRRGPAEPAGTADLAGTADPAGTADGARTAEPAGTAGTADPASTAERAGSADAAGAVAAPPEALPWVGKAPSVEHEQDSTAHYLSYLADRPDSILGALRDIADAPGAALVHCAAGKDRTGTVVALALLTAGADPAAVVADYAASSERVAGIVDRLMQTRTYADNLRGRPLESHLSRPETMQGLLDQIDRAGGVQAFLAPYGWTAADAEALRRKLRE